MRHHFVLSLAAMSALAFMGHVSAAIYGDTSNLVIARVGGSGSIGPGAEAVSLVQYTPAGAFVNSLALPSSGPTALTLEPFANHNGKLHRSSDGRYLTLAGYRADDGDANDPSVASATAVPRVIGRIDGFGNIDTSTALTDAFDGTSIRAAASIDGSSFWIGGDNASGLTTSGGTRFATLGASTTSNISQVQSFGQPQTPDNIRDVQIFDGQLFNSSGSTASVGRNVFQVGSGLPESGAQTLTAVAPVSANVSSFYFLDLSSTEPGLDTLYTSGNNLRKFTKVNGLWVASGIVNSSNAQSNILATVVNGEVLIYQALPERLEVWTDASGYNGLLTGSPTTLVTAAANESFRGLAFAPVIPEPTISALVIGALAVAGRRARR